MNISPIQMVELSFRKLSIEVDFERLSTQSESRDAHAVLENVVIKTNVRFSKLDQEDRRGTPHFVTLRVQIDNAPDAKEPDQRFSPYLLDVEAGAVILLAHGIENLGDPQELIAVNGPALIWSGIREQVATITSRMPAGTILLPSVNFHDLRKEARKSGSASSQALAAPPNINKRPRAKKPQE